MSLKSLKKVRSISITFQPYFDWKIKHELNSVNQSNSKAQSNTTCNKTIYFKESL